MCNGVADMQDQMISADALKKSIADVKKCFTSENSDYKTGYISALSVVEGMIAYLIDPTPTELNGRSCGMSNQSGKGR